MEAIMTVVFHPLVIMVGFVLHFYQYWNPHEKMIPMLEDIDVHGICHPWGVMQ